MNPFRELPDNFFRPLSFRNKEHYAALLLTYYELFLEYHTGAERALVVSAFEQYFIGLGNVQTIIESEDLEPEQEKDGAPQENRGTPAHPRELASLFLRQLIRYGWMIEEQLADLSHVVNMPVWAKPFYEALSEVAKGVQIEYESHIIGVYSSLCSDSANENGHHAVLNARNHTRLLIDSLKVLAQNIKTHVQKMFEAETEVKDLLHIHYDVYMREIVDKAYNRLKTSDNLSKYRPLINQAINRFLADENWLSKAAIKLAVIKNRSREESRNDLVEILKEIRDDLRSIDPILEEIDDKNRQYSRISTEKIKTRLYADASLEGKILSIIRSMKDAEASELHRELAHHLPDTGYLSKESLYTRRHFRSDEIEIARPERNDFEVEKLEAEYLLRVKNQLNQTKIAEFLASVCHSDGSPTAAEEIVRDMESFVRLLYAAAYAEGRRQSFPFRVEWEESLVRKGRFQFRAHRFIPVSGKEKTRYGTD
jgi:hypothetical protein